MALFILLYFYILPIIIFLSYATFLISKSYQNKILLIIAIVFLYPSYKVLKASYDEIVVTAIEHVQQPTLELFLPEGFNKNDFKVYIEYINYDDNQKEEKHILDFKKNEDTFILRTKKDEITSSNIKIKVYIGDKEASNYSNHSYGLINGRIEVGVKNYDQYLKQD